MYVTYFRYNLFFLFTNLYDKSKEKYINFSHKVQVFVDDTNITWMK